MKANRYTPVVDTSRSPFATLRPIGVHDVQWDVGLIAERVAACRTQMVPTMRRLMTETERVRYVGNFEVASGIVEGRHRGPKWNDGDFYKWLEAAIVSLDGDDSLGELIRLIATAQQPDGYIHTPVIIAQRNRTAGERFADPMHFEMYNMGHLITTGVMHHRLTGRRDLLELGIRAADFLDREFATPTVARARHGICPSHLMALVELFRDTREKRYLDLAVRLLAMRDLVENGDDDNQDRVPFRDQREAVGHAVRATYLYASVADLYAETGDASLRVPLDSIWHDLVNRKLAITGGCGALFDGASPDGIEDQTIITRVHQAFGRPWQLPHSTAHNETCAAIGNLMWNWRMFLITGDSKYADIVETTFFNSVLAGVSLDGTAFFYTNTLRQLDTMPVPLRWSRRREKFISCFCCPPNVLRTIAEIGGYALAVGENELRFVLYGGGVVTTRLPGGEAISLKIETNYPWDGEITVRVLQSPQHPITLAFRIPGWCERFSLSADGTPPHSHRSADGFARITRQWRPGESVTLHLDMPSVVLEAHPLVEEARNQVAVVRGPIVYCVESPDLPPDVKLQDVTLSPGATFTPESDPSLGVIALRTQLGVRESIESDLLYRRAARDSTRRIDARLIPYFAWDNRGKSEMTVWIPRA